MFLYLLNLDHDLALSCHEANYMPPDAVKGMMFDLALLPIWFAPDGSAVLASPTYNQNYLADVAERFRLQVRLMVPSELKEKTSLEVVPWGWNLALRRYLLECGLKENQLPSPEEVEVRRALSHRRSAVELLPTLQLNDWFCGESFFLTDDSSCRWFIESHECCVLKSPLSGSGKGLNWCKGVYTPSIAGWCKRVIRQQDGVVAEPIYQKQQDFAMEFYSDGCGRISFVGYSMFTTNRSGAYLSNELLSDEQIESYLGTFVPLSEIKRLRTILIDRLTDRLSTRYTGFLGVDMMICSWPDAPNFRIHPCVEINLRMNMGIVARRLFDRLVAPDRRGEFRITYSEQTGEALTEHQQALEEAPLVCRDGKIESGYLALTPIYSQTHYRAWIKVHS